MKLLALESSGASAGAAVFADGKLLCEAFCDVGLTHSVTFMPMVEQVLQNASVAADGLDYIAVDVGPGSFTGVRIGVCAANALALACGAKIVPVDVFQTLCAALPYAGLCASVVDARADRVYAALHDTSAGLPKLIGEHCAGTIGEWLALLPAGQRICFIGDGAKKQREVIAAAQNDRALFAPGHLHMPFAANVGACAYAMLGAAVDQCEPLYLRPPQADRHKGPQQ